MIVILLLCSVRMSYAFFALSSPSIRETPELWTELVDCLTPLYRSEKEPIQHELHSIATAMSTTPVHPLQRYGYGQGRSFPSKHLDFRTRGISGPGNNRSRRSALLDTPNFWRDLDLSQVLGDNETYGHTGCVNALSWSHDGSQLLSGSDDAR